MEIKRTPSDVRTGGASPQVVRGTPTDTDAKDALAEKTGLPVVVRFLPVDGTSSDAENAKTCGTAAEVIGGALADGEQVAARTMRGPTAARFDLNAHALVTITGVEGEKESATVRFTDFGGGPSRTMPLMDFLRVFNELALTQTEHKSEPLFSSDSVE